MYCMCKVPIIHMFHTCNEGVYTTYVLHVFEIYVSATYVIHIDFYICNTPKSPYMYYRCSTNSHVIVSQIHYHVMGILP